MGKLYDTHLKAKFGKPQDKVVTLTDGDGLGARVSKLGKIRWQFRYKINGANKRVDLGDYPELSLVAARKRAAQCRQWWQEGHDPKHMLAMAREANLAPVTVQQALEYWLVEYADKNRKNSDKHRAQFNKHIYPYIGSYPLEQTLTRHWVECFDRISNGIPGKQRPAPKAAGYVLQNAKQALRFCRVRQYAFSRELDDLTTTDVGERQAKRDRVLSDVELVDVWELCHSKKLMPYYRNMFYLLMVFGARTQEIRLSQWQEWDFDSMLWTVPVMNSKTAEKIVRPIPQALKDWLLTLKGEANKSNYILGELKRPEAVSSYGGLMWKRLDHIEKWTLHDLRRTMATKLNDLGVLPHVVEKLLGHSLGGVMAVYNHSQYLGEKEHALKLWVEHLQLLSNPPANVVLLK
ncbi:site-specific integrase [Photobacterium gaetbulicola]|uniref:Phage integrase family site specific recombinase n=2 Tax=Photobacterium gaetbulicola TaxID=1295392 RepID=A0A0C5WKS6_9GAMM|nr:site-specific integrase [Photobacterium gaetbulicola]AJR06887.1 phage integrase family site specific recombinase [Photobacterium gaetbulicola Gung47]KHT64793.1 integrase [Photobacterium gaetbulicola]PSU00778.1 site-specific integrase [Photobacterium gaetbulicola]